ncbi:conserved domain protein, putative [Cyanobium sp. PCC 7001]|uniref:AI-2E family transporter n=1 Tax=Cyanobium sp. PCC 7001 TaxID=180281 RepID=UPI00018051F0|nr:AI-2E family transporter [Cyanobium sp. PCC 7001]EDY39543.1 conserved domain protein, putative [Cyanobium sp. PCC 7001]
MNDLNAPAWRRLSHSALLRFLLLLACGWGVVKLIDYFQAVLTLFIAAAMLAVLLDFPVRRLVRLGCARSLAILLTVLGTLGVVGLFVQVLGSQLINQGSTLLNDLVLAFQRPDLPFHSFLKTIEPPQLIELLRASLGTSLGVVGGAFTSVFGSVFLVVIVVYMLIDNGATWRQLLRLLPIDVRDRFDRSVQKNVLGFLRGQVTLMIFLCLASLLVFAVLGVKFSLLLAIVVGVLDAIPGIGATLGVIVAATVVFLTQGQWLALQVVIASVVLQQIQDNLIHPRVMGRVLEIQPVVLFFALFVGERLAGLLGVFLAIPVAGMLLGWSRGGEEEGSPVTTPSP